MLNIFLLKFLSFSNLIIFLFYRRILGEFYRTKNTLGEFIGEFYRTKNTLGEF